MKRNKTAIVMFLIPACILFLLVYLVPIILVLYNSTFNYKLFPAKHEFIGLGNFIKLFSDETFIDALKNTLIWIVLHCTIHVLIGVILAFILYKKPKGWKFTRVVYMIPNIISQSAIAMIFLNIFNPTYGALNGILKAIGLESLQNNWLFNQATAYPAVTMSWILFAGYTTTLVLAQALSLDENLIEAAKLDGASDLQTDFYIMLPLVKNMIGTTVLMAATYMLQLFSLIYIQTGGGPGTTTTNLPLLLYTNMQHGNYGYANAVGVVIIVIGFISMTIINKLFRMNED